MLSISPEEDRSSESAAQSGAIGNLGRMIPRFISSIRQDRRMTYLRACACVFVCVVEGRVCVFVCRYVCECVRKRASLSAYVFGLLRVYVHARMVVFACF